MESMNKEELLEMAIKQLMEEENREKTRKSSSDGSFIAVDDDADEHRLLLIKLLSQLEALRAEGKLQLPEPVADAKGLTSLTVGKVEAKSKDVKEVDSGDSSGIGAEEVVKELRNVKKQNFITHCLLSVMIALTVAWQISEVSLILKVKDGVSHPFRSVGSKIIGMLKGPLENGHEAEKQSTKQSPTKLIESSSLPGLKIPELPQMGLPAFDLSAEDN